MLEVKIEIKKKLGEGFERSSAFPDFVCPDFFFFSFN